MLVNTDANKPSRKDTRRESAIQEEITDVSKKIQLFGKWPSGFCFV